LNIWKKRTESLRKKVTACRNLAWVFPGHPRIFNVRVFLPVLLQKRISMVLRWASCKQTKFQQLIQPLTIQNWFQVRSWLPTLEVNRFKSKIQSLNKRKRSQFRNKAR
jgi:hypothetical protein